MSATPESRSGIDKRATDPAYPADPARSADSAHPTDPAHATDPAYPAGPSQRATGRRFSLAMRLILPAVWLGIIIAIDGFEAPLKFQAPGITIPLGLGIGKLVFTAMNAAEIIIAAWLLFSVLRTKFVRPDLGWVWALIGMLALKVAVVRPLLNIRTEAVIAGEAAPFGYMHTVYIVVDFLIVVALVVYLWRQARVLINPATASATEPRS